MSSAGKPPQRELGAEDRPRARQVAERLVVYPEKTDGVDAPAMQVRVKPPTTVQRGKPWLSMMAAVSGSGRRQTTLSLAAPQGKCHVLRDT